MLHTVIFLVTACEFVLFDETIVVVVNMSGEHDAVLDMPVHRLGIEIIARLLILHKPTLFYEMGELSLSFGINTWVVLIRSLWKVDFRTNDVVE